MVRTRIKRVFKTLGDCSHNVKPLTHSYLFGAPHKAKQSRPSQCDRSLTMFNHKAVAFYKRHKVPVCDDGFSRVIGRKNRSAYSFEASF
jgi:hypothetical protein